MRRLLAPLFLVAIVASFPASLLIIFMRGMVSPATVGGRVDACAFAAQYYGSYDGNMDSYDLPSHGGGISCSVGVDMGKRSSGTSLVAGLLFTHAIPTRHDALPPSRYPMVGATAASTIVASTTTTTRLSHSPPPSSSSSSGAKVRILRSVMAESSHSRGSSNYKPRQPRSIPGPSLQEPGSSLRQKQSESTAEVGGGNAAAAAQESSPSSSATHQQIPHVTETPSDALKITVLRPLRGKSHSCGYSLVEFTNSHPIDAIVLHSTHVEPIVVFPPGLASNHSASLRKIQGEYDQDRHMLIPPQTSITIPVSILPQWRKPPEDSDFRPRHTSLCHQIPGYDGCFSMPSSMENAESVTKTYTAIDVDVINMVASSKNGYLHRPPATYVKAINDTMMADIFDALIVNTSWGVVQMKVPYASCSPQTSMEYDFNLPNNLMFLDGGGGWYARGNTTPESSLKTTLQTAYLFGDWESNYPSSYDNDPFIHGIFMDNPTDSELNIWEVYTTKPNFVNIEIQLQYVDPWQSPSSSSHPTIDVNDFYPLRGKVHPAKQGNIYVATLRLLPLNFTMEQTSAMQDLGFFVVRTNLGTFSIALNFMPNAGRGGLVIGTIINKGAALVGIHLVEEYAIGNMLQSRLKSTTTKPSMCIGKIYHAKDFDITLMARDQIHVGMGLVNQSNAITTNDWTNPSFVTPAPEKIDFGTITTGSRMIHIPLNLTNHHTNALRVMRISVVMSTISDHGLGTTMDCSNENNLVEIGVGFSDGNDMKELGDGHGESYVFTRDFVLPPSILESPLYVWCRFNASSDETVNERLYMGSILIRTSEIDATSFTYHDWERQVLLGLSSLGRSRGRNTTLSSPHVLEIPFQGSVLLGNIGSRTESLLFPTRFSNLPVDERGKFSEGTDEKVPKYYDRNLEITNNFAVPITIIGMRILDSHGGRVDNGFCKSRFSFNSEALRTLVDGRSPLIAESGEMWRDLLIRYRFIDDDYSDGINAVQKCILSLETDRAGTQSMPLIIYSGELFVDVERSDKEGKLPAHCVLTKDGSTITSRSGAPCMNNLIGNSVEGILLKTILQKQLSVAHQSQHMKRGNFEGYFRKCPSSIGSDPIDCYFRSLLPCSALGGDQSHISLQPIVMPFGAINAGKTMTLSLFLTNLNHVPIEVMATTAAVGNMNITIGVIPSLVHGSFDRMLSWPGKGDVAHFLHNTSVANDFFSRFTYQFDIIPSTRARRSELLSLFQRKVVIDTFQDASEYLTNYIQGEDITEDYPFGFLLSSDGYEKTFQSRKIGKKAWTIPPGGVARFSIAVTAPERSELKNDVTQFVGTGLVLQTNHGQAMPIVLTFSALSGQLRLRPWFDSQGTAENKQPNEVTNDSMEQQNTTIPSAIQVPLTLAGSSLVSSVQSILQERGVLLSLESTFRHDLHLSDIRSCNRWFSVIPHSKNMTGFVHNYAPNEYLRMEGVENDDVDYSADERLLNRAILPLGRVISTLACSHLYSHSSFFACALAWLENRDWIQPPGCGLSEDDVVTQWMSNAAKAVKRRISLDTRISTVKLNAIRALRDVVALLSVRYVDETPDNVGAESTVAYIPYSRIHMFQHAQKMWNEVQALGLNVITGHINAKTIITSTNINRTSNETSENIFTRESNYELRQKPLAIPISSVLLQSKLEYPILFLGGERNDDSMGVVDFGTVHVADTIFRHVSIVNPTAMTIRVRLAAVDSIDGGIREGAKSIYVQNTPDDHHPWWTGASYCMSNDQGHLIFASHNVTIKSGVGAFVSLLNPALHTMSAFVVGCGNRCGLRNEYDSNGDGYNYSPIGSGSGDSSILLGRPLTGRHIENKSPQQVLGMNSPLPFSFARFSSDIYIEPYGAADLGPVYFRPPGRGDFESRIYIENSLTGFEEVKLTGRGGWESLVFLDQISGHGGDVEFRFGKSALVFTGSQLQSGLGIGMGPVVKSVRLTNNGDVPVDITSVHMASSEVIHFTNKRRHSSLTTSSRKRCSERGFVLPGCDDSFFSFWGVETSSWFNVILNFIRKHFLVSKSEILTGSTQPEEVHSFYKNGFTLQPNQTQNISIMHYPDCIFQTSYSSVIFELGGGFQQVVGNRKDSKQQAFRRRQVELLVGYDMSRAEFRQCVPCAPSESSISMWGKNVVFQVSSLVQDVLTFGLTRSTDKNGNPYIPRRPIEMTILVACLMLLIMALSLDLILSVDLSTVPKFLPSWKPTCRCLARADPTSSDLLSLGKEQTKHVLLSRFKKEGALASNCVHMDGSFHREEIGLNGSGTHSEAIFGHLNLVNESESKKIEGDRNETKGLLPCGLSWRTAMKHGVRLPPLPTATCYSKNENHLLARSLRVMSKRQDEKVVGDVCIARATPFTSTSSQDHGAVYNIGKATNEKLTARQSKVKLPGAKVPAPGIIKENVPTIEPKRIKLVSNGGGDAYGGEDALINNIESDKQLELMHQHTSYPTRESWVVQKSQYSSFTDTKEEQKQRDETKNSKNERFLMRTEFSRDFSKQVESSCNPCRADPNLSARSTRSVDTLLVSNGKRNERGQNEHNNNASPHRKELTSNQSKIRQTKKPINGTKTSEGLKGKQDKSEATVKEVAAIRLRKNPDPTNNSRANKPQSRTEQPTSNVLQAQTSKRQFTNVRPPPGLPAPPGFSGQPDLEGVSSPSSPSSSHRRVSSLEIQLTPTCIEMSSAPLPDSDFFSLIGSEKVSLENAFFKPPYDDNSPRTLISNEVFVLPCHSGTFTPPIIQASPTAETNDAEVPDVQALLGAGSNFNVSNFLNGILSESTQCQQSPSRQMLHNPAEIAESDPLAAIAVGVSLDPWNNSDVANINPLENILQGVMNHPSPQISVGVPLNSDSSSHLNFGSAEYYSELAYARNISDEEDDSDSLEPDSFYNQLLGED